ncbi:hypothetical protein EVAR_68419_1 [Eumeta japonica]|uniref:Uncharacterized protein n=1 Tax=Eumeta variegata TaxID=151549 RepID=A0A4C1ZWT9_EUMVA|nr:hypothetical protein EVAR_68419_1 [Eumeta japonica]
MTILRKIIEYQQHRSMTSYCANDSVHKTKDTDAVERCTWFNFITPFSACSIHADCRRRLSPYQLDTLETVLLRAYYPPLVSFSRLTSVHNRLSHNSAKSLPKPYIPEKRWRKKSMKPYCGRSPCGLASGHLVVQMHPVAFSTDFKKEENVGHVYFRVPNQNGNNGTLTVWLRGPAKQDNGIAAAPAPRARNVLQEQRVTQLKILSQFASRCSEARPGLASRASTRL